MRYFQNFIVLSYKAVLRAVLRFPLTVLALLAEAGLTCYVISLDKDPNLNLQKWIFILLFSAFVGLATTFILERFKWKSSIQIIVYGGASLVLLAYALIIWPSPEINYLVGARTSVAIFSLICLTLWIPSYKDGYGFHRVSLVHFKSFFTSVLYAAVLDGGLSAILAAINILLFRINGHWYGYIAAIVWILFATLYDLSLLPKFNATDEPSINFAMDRSEYPKLLKILISYIAIPLITTYTLVLLAYFVKIVFTQVWPIGQLGPMILAYSALGFILFILASSLENKFSKTYQVLFPKVLILIVLVQISSIVIRIQAYGFTESRYYLGLFALYTLVMAILLSFKWVKKLQWIAIIAMCFALVSVIPPLDAFSVSRASQKDRLETLLTKAGVLSNQVIVPQSDVDLNVRLETTSILDYMNQRHYLVDLSWLPQDFNLNQDFKSTFGFESAYGSYMDENDYFYASLNRQEPIDIVGYDVYIQHSLYRQDYEVIDPRVTFTVKNQLYTLEFNRSSEFDVVVKIVDSSRNTLVETPIYGFVESLQGITDQPKEELSLETMSFNIENTSARMRIIFQFINVNLSGPDDPGADYEIAILIDILN